MKIKLLAILLFILLLIVASNNADKRIMAMARLSEPKINIDSNKIIEEYCYNAIVADIKKSEGFKSELYYCPGGCPTIGYGHVIRKEDSLLISINEAQAEVILKRDLNSCIKLIKANTNLEKPNEVLAMSHFVYCLGIGTFLNSSLPKLLEKNKKIDNVLLSYCKYRNKDSVLVESGHIKKNRRMELSIFNLNTDSLVQSSVSK